MADRQNVPEEALFEVTDWVSRHSAPFRELMTYYRCAMMELETKFKVLNEELSLVYDRNPIESVKSRLKTPESIMEKLERKGLPKTLESIENNIEDVAGVRVICSFPADIYKLADSLMSQDDLRVVKIKDYIKNPKDNGYRSLHLIVDVPIFLQDAKKTVKAEIQFRTIGMDWWASLEHKIIYKQDVKRTDELTAALLHCAQSSYYLDEEMENIYFMATGKGEEAKDAPFEKKDFASGGDVSGA
ncbi:MAG: GTP pyrophosphokinase family protein [Eubacterium sp.]|nr:GTP pyrophosphokinase family protein [Eubacterium sp.]MBR3276635.1 GTP pyrophosphokinase family protein [Eubacterium sp.]